MGEQQYNKAVGTTSLEEIISKIIQVNPKKKEGKRHGEHNESIINGSSSLNCNIDNSIWNKNF